MVLQFSEFMQSTGRGRILQFWKSAKAFKDKFLNIASSNGYFKTDWVDLSKISKDDIYNLTIDFLQIWNENFVCKDPLTQMVDISSEILSGFESIFGKSESGQTLQIDIKVIYDLFFCIDEV